MGLDMMLYGEKVLSPKKPKEKKVIEFLDANYVPGQYLFTWNEELKHINDFLDNNRLYGQVGNVKEANKIGDTWKIVTEAIYWRKANAIHRWFTDNCQAGIGNCEMDPILPEQLQELAHCLLTIQGNKEMAIKLLPTESGFFFGSTNYDYSYEQQIKRTITELKSILKPSTIKNWQFYYYASW